MRALVHTALTSNMALTAEIPAARWFQAGSIDEPPPRPFAMVRLTERPPTPSGGSQAGLQVWIHDDRGSYLKIDKILTLVRAALVAALPMEDATSRIVAVDWQGDSGDLTDEGYNTNARIAQFQLTGRK